MSKNFLKVVFLGESGVGKTCLIQVLTGKKFSNQYKETLSADLSCKTVQIENQTLQVQIWDTVG